MRIELVGVIDEGNTIAGSLEPDIDLVVARHGRFELRNKD